MKVFALVWTLIFCGVGTVAQADEVYRWVDENGRTHFSQNLHEVPPKYRPQAKDKLEEASDEANPIQVLGNAPPIEHRWKDVATPTYRKGSTKVQLKPTRGDNFIVQVRLNDKLTVPFMLDTGASTVTITQEIADQLGIVTGPNTKYARFNTANGVIKAPIITLDSVEVGGAEVNNVRASIPPNLHIGLLGTSFLNNFQYSIDPVGNVLTLRLKNKEQ
jgi:aspartyl protease family protein